MSSTVRRLWSANACSTASMGPNVSSWVRIHKVTHRGGHRVHRPSPGTMALMALTTPTLSTARLHLRPFTGADADALFALHSNAQVLRFWDSPPWTDRARAARFIEKCLQLSEDSSGARV